MTDVDVACNAFPENPMAGKDLVSRERLAAYENLRIAASYIPPDCGICNGGVTIEEHWPNGLCPLCGELREALAALDRLDRGQP